MGALPVDAIVVVLLWAAVSRQQAWHLAFFRARLITLQPQLVEQVLYLRTMGAVVAKWCTKRVISPVREVVNGGITPSKLALSIALGFTAGSCFVQCACWFFSS